MPTDVSTSSTEQYDTQVNAPAGGDPRTSASVRNPLQSLTNRIRFMWARLQGLIGTFLPIGGLYPIPLSVSGSTFTLVGHGLSANDQVRLFAINSLGGSLPSPLFLDTIYFAIVIDANTFQLATTSGGSAISLTSQGGGPFYASRPTAGAAPWVGHNNNFTGSKNIFTGDVEVDGSLILPDGGITGNVEIAGNAKVDDNLTVTGSGTFGGNLSAGGTFSPAIVNPSKYYSGAMVDQSPAYTGTSGPSWTIGDPGTPVTATSPAPSGSCNQIISPIIRFSKWGDSGTAAELDVHLLAHSGTDNPEMTIIFDPANDDTGTTTSGGAQMEIFDDSSGSPSGIFAFTNLGTALANASNSGSVTVVWRSDVGWRVKSFSGFYGMVIPTCKW